MQILLIEYKKYIKIKEKKETNPLVAVAQVSNNNYRPVRAGRFTFSFCCLNKQQMRESDSDLKLANVKSGMKSFVSPP